MSDSDYSALVSLEGIRKAFPGVQALDQVSFDVLPGEVHVLMGENGAGKSTLMKILSGAYQPDSGAIRINGREVHLSDPLQANRLGIAMIYQELTLLDNLDVGRNVLLGQEPSRSGLVDWGRLYREAETVLRDLDLALDARASIGSLNMGERQMVEIARAAHRASRVLVMDEPTSSLTKAEEETLFALIERLKARGMGIIYISHRMDEVFRVADRITVLRDGKHIATRPASAFTQEELIALMVGREVDTSVKRLGGKVGQVVLDARGIVRGKRVRGVSIKLRSGEVVGMAGLVGAGRTELAEVLFGAARPDAGDILIDGQPVVFRQPQDAIARGIAYVPDDRKGLGLVLMLPVQTNLILAALERVAKSGVLSLRTIRETVTAWTERLNIRAASPKTNIELLSGGNQQKVVLARWLEANVKVLLLNEPTWGVDVGARSDIYDQLEALAAQGLAILMVSSDIEEVLSVSHRIVTIYKGRLTGAFLQADATQEKLLHAAAGGAA